MVACGRLGVVIGSDWSTIPFAGFGVGAEGSASLNIGYVPNPEVGVSHSFGCSVAYFGGLFGELGWFTPAKGSYSMGSSGTWSAGLSGGMGGGCSYMQTHYF